MSPAIRQARRKTDCLAVQIDLIEAGATSLPLADDTFDAVLLFLILSVAEVPQDCLKEVQRTARTGVTVVGFDKLLNAGQPTWTRRPLHNFGIEINRNFSEIFNDTELEIESQKSCGLGNSSQLIMLRNG